MGLKTRRYYRHFQTVNKLRFDGRIEYLMEKPLQMAVKLESRSDANGTLIQYQPAQNDLK
jgi:hypothetical protein